MHLLLTWLRKQLTTAGMEMLRSPRASPNTAEAELRSVQSAGQPDLARLFMRAPAKLHCSCVCGYIYTSFTEKEVFLVFFFFF